MEWKVAHEKNKNDEGMKKAYGRRRLSRHMDKEVLHDEW